jgi:hypothetical protein
MSELFLIAHKVRGEPAFDVAERVVCPECNGGISAKQDRDGFPACIECENLGYWWIIPTSGHRAYPYWVAQIIPLINNMDGPGTIEIMFYTTEMPEGLPDHYPHRSTPSRPSLTDLLPPQPVYRRF